MPGFRGNSIVNILMGRGPVLVAEIGVFDGSLSDTLLARLPDLELIMVDAWQAAEPGGRWAATKDTLVGMSPSRFLNARNQAIARTDFAADRRHIRDTTSLEAAKAQDDETLDMVFIDAEHSYEAVSEDIAAWWPKVKPGGWLAGHDWEPLDQRHFGVNEAVTEFGHNNMVLAGLEFGEDATWFIRKPFVSRIMSLVGPEYESPRTVHDYAFLIDAGRPFTQSNWGDGEWLCVFGEQGQNCDGHEYLPALSRDLSVVLENPHPHMHGLNPGMKLWPKVNEWRRRRRPALYTEWDIWWVEKEILANANCRGELGPFLSALRDRKVWLVGPQHLSHQDMPIRPDRHIVVPDRNCYTAVESVVDALSAAPCDIILFCASMATNVMIHRLWPVIGDRVTMLDCGALFDPYCGVFSRNGYRKPHIPETMQKNREAAMAC